MDRTHGKFVRKIRILACVSVGFLLLDRRDPAEPRPLVVFVAQTNRSSSSPLARTMMPSGLMVNPRARSSIAVPADLKAAGNAYVLVDDGAANSGWRPTSTPSNRIASSINAKLLIRTPGETMLRKTWPPEMIAPWQTIEL